MNTHDKIELPPLPRPQVPRIDADIDLMDIRRLATWCEMTAKDYARAAIDADRKRRGEPVAWLYEDELPDSYPYEAMFPYSKVDGVRMFPVDTPQHAEPVKVPSDAETELLDYAMAIAHERELCVLGHKHDSDAAVDRFRAAVRRMIPNTCGLPSDAELLKFIGALPPGQSVPEMCRALLARYGAQPAQPAEWEDFPK